MFGNAEGIHGVGPPSLRIGEINLVVKLLKSYEFQHSSGGYVWLKTISRVFYDKKTGEVTHFTVRSNTCREL